MRANTLVDELRTQGGKACAVQADISDPDQVSHLFTQATQLLGPLYGLVNNAGITGSYGRLEELSNNALKRTLDINLLGTLLCCREAIRYLAPRYHGEGGCIVNISSIAARLGSPNEYVHYAASKGGVDALTVGLACELAEDKIRVNAISPGIVDTEIHARGGAPDRVARVGPTVPMGRAGQPTEIAAAVLWLLSPQASYITGANLNVSGGR